jgi:hypothetical protein
MVKRSFILESTFGAAAELDRNRVIGIEKEFGPESVCRTCEQTAAKDLERPVFYDAMMFNFVCHL